MLDSAFYAALERFRLAVSHKTSMNMAGSRKSTQKGISAEFSDFREYRQGDDLRRLDWNAYARLDKLYIREYMEEKEIVVSVLIDTSASMNYGSKPKAELARELASIVSFLALNNSDRVVLYDMKAMHRGYVLRGGRQALVRAAKWLESLEFSGECDMLEAARQLRTGGQGVTILISDFLSEQMLDFSGDSYEKLIRYLDYRKQRPVVLQVLAAEELRIELAGTLNLIDQETGDRLRLTMDAHAISAYEGLLEKLKERLAKGARPGSYVLCDTAKDLKTLVFTDLRELYDI